MKSAFEKLESPYLGGELQFVIPPDGLSNKLAHAIAESPFANLLASVRGAETGESLHSAVEPAGFEALAATAAQPGKMLDEQLWAERSPAENEATEGPFESPSSFADVGESLGVPQDADESPANEAEAHEREALAFLEEGQESGDAFPEFEEQVFTLPPSLPSLPNDATLRGQLRAIGTAEARALDAAFAVFGDPARFSNRLPPALNAAFESLRGAPKQRFRFQVTRLGAEAFILDTPIEPGNRYDHFVDHPDRLGSALTGADQRNWVHFAMRRLHQISPIVVKPPTHRRQMGRAAALFRRFQSELTSNLPIFDDKALPLAYRTLTVQILWRHYQALQDLVLEAAAKGGLNWAVASKDWDADLRSAAITREVDDADATVPTFRLTATLYRDYFHPSAASDIGYGHFTATPIPFTGHGPDIPFRIVFQRRAEQRAFVERLRKERPADPLPKLHDTASWQAWARKTWDSPLLRRETKLEVILKHVSGYFEAFTVHAPHDLREGCSVPNYLIRAFPRAITGSPVHDCFVYAVRWLHVLGRLLTRGSMPLGIANPRIFLIEMPAHVGVMIRADTTALNRHVVISINNKHAEIHERAAGETDKAAAEIVVQDMYRGPKTPFVLRPLTSNPADAKTLWNEVCKLSEKKLVLPYKDSNFPPHLRYLKHNALLANISREHLDAVRASWATLHQRLEAAKDGRGNVLPARVIDEIRRHRASFEKANQAAKARLDKEREPLIKEINDDLAVNRQRVAKEVWIIETKPSVPFISAVEAYRKALEEVIRSRNLPAIDPREFFPEDDFVAAVE